MNSRDKKYLLELIERYQNGIATDEEIKHLSNFFISHQESKGWPLEEQFKNGIKEKIFKEVQIGIQNTSKEHVKVKPLFYNHMFKYAAAILVMITTGYFLTNNNFFDKTSLVVDNNIEIGTDKATLTLEDGSNIALEKGENYTTATVSSDGEKLVYNANKAVVIKPEQKIIYNYLTIPRGGEFYLELADDTRIWLNSESKIKYPVTFVKGKTRKVELLYGEAYFEVSPSKKHDGAKFEVLTKEHRIEVLGTEFNIKAYNNDITTTLVEGKVAVEVDQKKKNLSPSQQSNYNLLKGTIQISVVDTYSETSWRRGYFNFTEKSFEEVAEVLSRWYDVEFQFENEALAKLKINGVLRKNQNIEYILITLKNLKNITYEIKENKIIIK